MQIGKPLLVALLLATSPVEAAEIVLFQSALATAVRRDVFGPAGKRTLSGNPAGCSYAVVEQPETTLGNGRLHLRARFTGRAAIKMGNDCVGPGDAFWLEVSGVPAVDGDTLRITNVRLDEGKAIYRPLLERLIRESVAGAVQINLRTEIQKVLGGAGPYKATVPKLTIAGVSTTDAAITINFDFRLEAR